MTSEFSEPHPQDRGRRSRGDRGDRNGDRRREREERPGRPRLEPRVLSADQISPRKVDQDALRVISRLSRNGYEAYMVGGCVRDLLLGRKPKDFDVATEAHPRQIKRLFRNGRIIGRRFKLVHVIYGDKVIETATFRREPEQRGEDHDNDDDLLIIEDNVFGDAAEDALRRDFTINALFHDPLANRILDYVGGLEDLDAGVLRTIGEPAVRFAEDPVRILRAIKFATRLAFRIEEDTWMAMCEAADDLSRAAAPRVLEEILRLLRSGTALGAFRMMRACGALRVLLPQVDEFLGDRNDPKAQERAESFWRLLEALDNDVHAGFEPSTSLSLAVLFLRVVEREADPDQRSLPGRARDLPDVADEVMDPLVRPARVSRRAVGRSQRIIANQARFSQSSSKTFRPLLFMHQDDFEESLQLFRLRSAAWGQGWDLYEAWVARYEEAKGVPPEELEALRKKRRRRGRRRRRSPDES